MSPPRLLVALSAAALLAPIISPGSHASAQSFAQRALLGSDLFVTDANTDFWINAVAPADVDGDGDLDLAVLGFYVVYHESVEHILVVFQNDGAAGTGWSFTEQRVPLGDSSPARPTWPGATTTTTAIPIASL